METYVIRNFLYLDRKMVEDGLAAIEGALYDEKVVQTQERTTTLSGEGGIPTVAKAGGKREAKETVEVAKQAVLSDAARFQRLFAYIERQSNYGYYEGIDESTWASIARGNMMEAVVNISFSKLGQMAAVVSSMAGLGEALEVFTGETLIDEAGKNRVRGLEQLAKYGERKGIPIIMKLVGSPEYKLVTYLDPTLLLVEKERLLVGEVSVLCKVQRKLGPKEKLSLFDPLDAIEALELSRAQRRQFETQKTGAAFQDVVKPPAALVIPLGIYR